ncbi:peptidylprolyl isomerase [Blastopirellula marina]|uniref:peptidylprolyl isomerase n=1 Tax=Blastopirellula marina TaxID=124 RepID=A0A2S8F4J1_9BACT|nr:peptidylprolyl isomerase [Blastopirellula marina]PQO26844.1 peptidylprolyl isomerase [Blastopirellula marina]PTL41051.1 peptidylprolyl isomerase [Blastopirellula marina]
MTTFRNAHRTTWAIIAGGFVLVAVGVIAVRNLGGVNNAVAQQPQAAQAAAKANAAPQIKTVAVVNREPITREELGREAARRYGEGVLESVINKHLIAEECRKLNITITETEIDAEIENTAKKFSLSVDRWLGLLKDERNVTPAQYRTDIVWPTMALRRLAASRLEVTQEEFDKAWQSEFGPKVKCRMISVSDRALAEELRAKAAANPEAFADLAKDFSEDPNSAAARGLIPPIRQHMGAPEVEQLVFALKEGEVSQVLFTANQYLIFKCESLLPATQVEATKQPEIQQRIVEAIREHKLRNSAGDVYKELQEKAQIENFWTDPTKRQQNPGVVAVLNGQKIMQSELEEECITRHGVEVLDGEINRRILQQALKLQNLDVTEQDLNDEISRAADSYGFLKSDGSPDFEAWLEEVTKEQSISVEVYVRDAVWPTVALKKLVAGKVKVTEEDLQKGFEANYGERVQILAIVLDNQRRANEVWDLARKNPSEQFFGELARQYSIEPVSKNNDGQVPPIRRNGGQPELEKAAFALQPGELSGLINIGRQTLILKALGRTKPTITDISVVRDELYKDIHEKKIRLEMAKQFDALKEEAQIDNFLANTTQMGKKMEAAARQQSTR